MANKVEALVANAPITCPAEKYYNFFKDDMNKIIDIFPAGYTGVEVLEGKEGVAGNVKLWHYIIGGVAMEVKVLTEVIDDATKTIKFVAVDGDVLQVLYKSFNVILTVSEGFAKWTVEYEKATILSPPPELYVPFFATLATLVNAYLLVN